MQLFDTWLGFLGCMCGLMAAAIWNWPAIRSAAIGFAVGIAVVMVVNLVAPSPAPCLQSAKGWDVWRAHLLCS